MTTQPEALRLAAELDAEIQRTVQVDMMHHNAAVELRRLYAENEALTAANERFGKRQEWWNERMFALEQQRDALLEALKLARSVIGHPDDAHTQMIDAAIKAVEGENHAKNL